MTTVKAFGLAALLVMLTLSLSYSQEGPREQRSDIVVVTTQSGTI